MERNMFSDVSKFVVVGSTSLITTFLTCSVLKTAFTDRRRLIALKNVFSTPELVEHILGYLDFERQKIYRQVSKGWNKEICRIFHKNGVTLFTWDLNALNEMLDSGQALKMPAPSPSLHVYADAVNIFLTKKFPVIPVTKLTLLNQEEADELVSTAAISLLVKCSPTLTHLSTHYWEGNSDEALLDSLRLPNLTTLRITHQGWYQENDPLHREKLQFFVRLIAESPKLVHLEMTFMRCIPELILESNLENIKKLVLPLVREDANTTTALLTKKMPNLENLRMDAYVESAENWNQVLSRFAPTIQSLNYGHLPTTLPMLFPLVTKIEARILHLGPFNLGNFPSLKFIEAISLDLIDPVNNGDPALITPCVSVEEISFGNFGSQLLISKEKRLQYFSTLFRYFPNATRWHIKYRFNETFCQAASSHLVKVRELEIVLDRRNSIYRLNHEALLRLDRKTFANLELLTNLEKLTLLSQYSNDYTPAGKLKDNGMQLKEINFDKMPNIKQLHIHSSNLTQMLEPLEHLRHLESITFVDLGGRSGSAQADKTFLFRMPNVKYCSVSSSDFASKYQQSSW